jgi:transcriptional regulator with XRE-family HTH domain
MESPQEQLGRNLAGQRKMAGLSQEELAFRANLDRTLISLIERGKRNARLDTLVKLGKGLGVPPASLLKGIPADKTAEQAGDGLAGVRAQPGYPWSLRS